MPYVNIVFNSFFQRSSICIISFEYSDWDSQGRYSPYLRGSQSEDQRASKVIRASQRSLGDINLRLGQKKMKRNWEIF